MNDDLDRLERELRERAAEVPYLQEAPRKMLARARRRVARNALVIRRGRWAHRGRRLGGAGCSAVQRRGAGE